MTAPPWGHKPAPVADRYAYWSDAPPAPSERLGRGDDVTDALDSPGIRFCWCPPMADPDDPDQHEAACAHAAFVERLRAMEKTPLLKPFRRPAVTNGGCYAASWGWVHVKPGCRCPR